MVWVLLMVLALLGVSPYVDLGLSRQTISEVMEDKLEQSFWVADAVDLQHEVALVTQDLESWLTQVNQSDVALLCLGETHQAPFREFLATAIFPRLNLDVLMLEGDEEQVAQALAAVDQGMATTNLTGVDMAGIIRAVKAHNPDAVIVGVDETPTQQRWRNMEASHSPRKHLSRDGFIAQNIQRQLQSGSKYVALFGAQHCAYYDLGLGNSRPFMRHLRSQGEVVNVNVVNANNEETSNQALIQSVLLLSATSQNPLTNLLPRTEMPQGAWAIANTHRIAPESYNFRWDVKAVLDSYDAIVYFPQ